VKPLTVGILKLKFQLTENDISIGGRMNIFNWFAELIAETCLDDSNCGHVISLKGKPVVYEKKADADYVERVMRGRK